VCMCVRACVCMRARVCACMSSSCSFRQNVTFQVGRLSSISTASNEEKSDSVSTRRKGQGNKGMEGYKKIAKRLKDEEFPVEYKRVLSITVKKSLLISQKKHRNCITKICPYHLGK
jgi:hypothetical protein